MEDFFFNLPDVDFDERLSEPLPPSEPMTVQQYEADAIADHFTA